MGEFNRTPFAGLDSHTYNTYCNAMIQVSRTLSSHYKERKPRENIFPSGFSLASVLFGTVASWPPESCVRARIVPGLSTGIPIQNARHGNEGKNVPS